MLYGNLISLPVGDGMLYVEPVYVKSTQAERRTAAAEGAAVVRRRRHVRGARGQPRRRAWRHWSPRARTRSLRRARTPGTTPPGTTPPGGTPVLTGPLAAAAAAVDAAIVEVKAAQASGDFARYGKALASLETAMTNFQNAQKAAAGTPAPSTSAAVTPSAAASSPAPAVSPSGG